MEIITKYKAVDGKEFNREIECIKYESLIETVKKIMNVLSPVPKDDNCSFGNGHGYLQHDSEVVWGAKYQILELLKGYTDHKWLQDTIDNENTHPSYVGRIIDELNLSPINSAWYRFSCIDKDNREWGQPFYANNPDKGEQIKLN